MKKLILVGLLTMSVAYAGDSRTELEHAIKTPSSVEDNGGDMSRMKAAGKCGANQKMTHQRKASSKHNKAGMELEHAMKTPSSVEDMGGDMSKMKAAGKCGGH
ncbi:MAG: hypothetical protein Q9M32_00770 [Sulfurimonas sp.]|nr:hypothetical protein [Sulfurimonas sp.]MDQ7061003.1 hypothetical protein [Sulfurimonas sp.]